MASSMTETSLESRIVNTLNDNPKGMTTAKLQEAIPSIEKKQMVEVLNFLLTGGKIEVFTQNKQLLYKAKGQSSKGSVQATDNEEKLIHQAIERSGTKGVTERELKTSTNLKPAQLKKILKSMELKKLIKSATGVGVSKRGGKVYVLQNVEVDQSVTGGIWYNGQEFESEFIDVLNQQCFQYLQQAKAIAEKLSDPISKRNASFKSSKDVCNYINGLKISKVQLSVKDVETILDTLIYDGKIEKSIVLSESVKNQGSENLYRVVKPLIASCGLMRMPCGVCQVFDNCYEGGSISPSTCEYMKEWLDY